MICIADGHRMDAGADRLRRPRTTRTDVTASFASCPASPGNGEDRAVLLRDVSNSMRAVVIEQCTERPWRLGETATA